MAFNGTIFDFTVKCPSPPTYTVNVYVRQGTLPSPSTSAFLYTSTDNVNWTYRGPIDTTACTLYAAGTFTVTGGSTLYFQVTDGSGNTSYYNAAASTSCPSNSATYCQGGGTTYSALINANSNFAITAYVQKFGSYLNC